MGRQIEPEVAKERLHRLIELLTEELPPKALARLGVPIEWSRVQEIAGEASVA